MVFNGAARNETATLSASGGRAIFFRVASALGGTAPDGIVDNVVVNGTNGDDDIRITRNGSGADVTGLATAAPVKHADITDVLSVNTRAGTNNVTTTGVAGLIQVLVDGIAA